MLNTHTLLKISRILLYATAVLPMVLWSGFTFPYVTIRTALFRIIVEVALVLVLVLWVQGRIQFLNLRRQYFLWIFAALIAVESAAAFFGESPLASFFGDMERMWGIVTVVHFFLFYLLLRTLFEERHWRTFFHTSLAASIGVSVYGIIQRNPEFFHIYLFGAGEGTRIMSALGNPTYVAVYLLFNVAFALYLLFRAKKGKLRYFYIVTVIVDLYALTLTDIRGAYLGLMLGSAAAAFVYLFLGGRRRAKQAIAAVGILGIIVLSLGVRFKSTDFVQRIPVLRRVVSVSLADETVRTRFIGWNAAVKGFLDDPLTGTGMENYNIVFNRYFPARYYLLAPTETYFDRAHNQFFNILAESGIVALLLYLLFPVAIGCYLIRGYRSRRFTLPEFLLFGALTIAYFVYLFFVFDEFHSLLFFSAFLALLEFRYRGVASSLVPSPESSARQKRALRAVVMLFLVPAVLYLTIFLNINTLRAARYAGRAFLSEDIQKSLDSYRLALSINLIPSENVTLNFVDYLLNLSLDEKIESIKADSALTADVSAGFSEAEQALFNEIKKKPNDMFFYLKLGQLNDIWFLIDGDAEHLMDAIAYLEHALPLSPERLQVYLTLGETYVFAREDQKAIDAIKQALSLEPEFGGSYYYLGRAYLSIGDIEKAYDAMVVRGFIEHKHNPGDLVFAYVLAEALAGAGEYEKMVTTYEQIARIDYLDPRAFSALSAGYVLVNRFDDAITAAQKAAELDPGFAPEAAAFIQAIQEGRIEELKQSVF